MVGVARVGALAGVTTANDEFKRQFTKWFWGSVTLATIIHFLIFVLFPRLTAGDVGFNVKEFETIHLPPEIQIPPPPKTIQRPAVPVVAKTEIEEDITIAPTTFEENPVENLPPPPDGASLGDQPVFTPYEVAPEMKDKAGAIQIILRYYPTTLREAGVGGTVVIHAFIDDRGRLKNMKLARSSGFNALDDAAMKALQEIGEKIGFTPALNRDKAVPVWIQQTITFSVRS